MKKIKVIITGATGMVGEAVLLECLQNEEVDEILIVNRRSSGYTHQKLKEILHEDFFNFSPLGDALKGFDACFFCLGVSSVGMKEAQYEKLTYTLTMEVAAVLSAQNAGMRFCYVSGAGTDSSEKGRIMWARVKGRTENHLQKLGFAAVYNFRPGMLIATPGQKFLLPAYKYFSWLAPIIRALAPRYICTLRELARAMINVSRLGFAKPVLEVKDIKVVARL